MRFVSREDRELVWSKRGKIKQIHQLEEAYITEDYARAIQKERQILIKAMLLRFSVKFGKRWSGPNFELRLGLLF